MFLIHRIIHCRLTEHHGMPKCNIYNHYALSCRISHSPRQGCNIDFDTSLTLSLWFSKKEVWKNYFTHVRASGLGTFHDFTMTLLETVCYATFAHDRTQNFAWKAPEVRGFLHLRMKDIEKEILYVLEWVKIHSFEWAYFPVVYVSKLSTFSNNKIRCYTSFHCFLFHNPQSSYNPCIYYQRIKNGY